ncbi:MAG: methylated-DNA--[protein]-cysteine S-methyltransferase [Planctomycetota bacterium]
MKNCQYNIFRTQWGWFGLLGNEQGVIRTCLPVANKEAVQGRLLSGFPDAEQSTTAFSILKKRILAYYEGSAEDFRDVAVCLEDRSEFQQKILSILRTVSYAETVSYRQLAQLAGNPKAARAIGSVMAQNPLPLIIPCHRVIKSDGTIGQFSAPGGTNAKKRMLQLEKS